MSLAVILIYVVLALVGLGLLAILLFGIRGLAYGKISPTTMILGLVPIVLLVILGFVIGNWSQAAIFTVLIMFALAILALLFTGVKGLFT